MTLGFEAATERPAADLRRLFERAFEGYVGGDIRFSPESFQGFLSHHGVNLALSGLALRGGVPVALGLIARRGWTSRLAAMGVLPEAQGQRVGSALLAQLIGEARQRGDRALELEVIEQNPRGLALYRAAGFAEVQRLLGFTARDPAGEADHALTETDIQAAASALVAHAPADTPWHPSGYNLVALGLPHRAYQLGRAWAIVGDPARDTVPLHALIVAAEARNQGHGRRLLRALFACHPGRTWRVVAVCPATYAPFFRSLGFAQDDLSQVQMRLGL